jgi:ElaB/YqjD/DUF883 family membrane-anchored ribosome-binding protein
MNYTLSHVLSTDPSICELIAAIRELQGICTGDEYLKELPWAAKSDVSVSQEMLEHEIDRLRTEMRKEIDESFELIKDKVRNIEDHLEELESKGADCLADRTLDHFKTLISDLASELVDEMNGRFDAKLQQFALGE